MKLIDEYLDSLYKNKIGKENIDLKEEMRQHLIESVNELKLEGLSEEEACRKSIERFDGGSEMQQELYAVIEDLSLSLDKHKSTLKITKRILMAISIICFLASITLWFYHENLGKSMNELTQEFNNEIKKLSEKYEMTDIDKYKIELEKLLKEERFDKVKVLELPVADMKEGNTSLNSSKVRADKVYSNRDNIIDDDQFVSLLGYDTKDFLDSHGNIVNPQIFTEHFFYSQSDSLAPALFFIGLGTSLGYIVLRFKNRNI